MGIGYRMVKVERESPYTLKAGEHVFLCFFHFIKRLSYQDGAILLIGEDLEFFEKRSYSSNTFLMLSKWRNLPSFAMLFISSRVANLPSIVSSICRVRSSSVASMSKR